MAKNFNNTPDYLKSMVKSRPEPISRNPNTVLKRMEKFRLKHGNEIAVKKGAPKDPKEYFQVRRGVPISKMASALHG